MASKALLDERTIRGIYVERNRMLRCKFEKSGYDKTL
jgi:putative component of membrane protein insertase Oxa1/YidC/SpoIIIJ protein YidD